MKLFGANRELLHLIVSRRGDFYVAFPQPVDSMPSLRPLDRHVSYHAEGQHHFRVREGVRALPTPGEPVRLQPTRVFRGIEQLTHGVAFAFQVDSLPLLVGGGPKRQIVILDADSVGFRKDAFFFNVYLLEPGQRDLIPTPPDVGPRVLEFIGTTYPWVAVELYQERRPC